MELWLMITIPVSIFFGIYLTIWLTFAHYKGTKKPECLAWLFEPYIRWYSRGMQKSIAHHYNKNEDKRMKYAQRLADYTGRTLEETLALGEYPKAQLRLDKPPPPTYPESVAHAPAPPRSAQPDTGSQAPSFDFSEVSTGSNSQISSRYASSFYANPNDPDNINNAPSLFELQPIMEEGSVYTRSTEIPGSGRSHMSGSIYSGATDIPGAGHSFISGGTAPSAHSKATNSNSKRSGKSHGSSRSKKTTGSGSGSGSRSSHSSSSNNHSTRSSAAGSAKPSHSHRSHH